MAGRCPVRCGSFSTTLEPAMRGSTKKGKQVNKPCHSRRTGGPNKTSKRKEKKAEARNTKQSKQTKEPAAHLADNSFMKNFGQYQQKAQASRTKAHMFGRRVHGIHKVHWEDALKVTNDPFQPFIVCGLQHPDDIACI